VKYKEEMKKKYEEQQRVLENQRTEKGRRTEKGEIVEWEEIEKGKTRARSMADPAIPGHTVVLSSHRHSGGKEEESGSENVNSVDDDEGKKPSLEGDESVNNDGGTDEAISDIARSENTVNTNNENSGNNNNDNVTNTDNNNRSKDGIAPSARFFFSLFLSFFSFSPCRTHPISR